MKSIKGQRGVAVITALLLTTLAVTIVASLFWQQQVQVRSMENQRLHLQIQWILRGTLDWTKLILQQEAITQPNYTSLKDVWAVPLANTRIDQYVDRERVAGETFDANLSGQIFDATARYNLANLARQGAKVTLQVDVFKQLLTLLRLDPALADGATKLIASSQEIPAGTNKAATAAKQMQAITLDDLLEVPGFTVEAVEKLRKFVIVLPEPTPVNVNTAPAEVLAAVLSSPIAIAQALVAQRDRSAWNTIGGFESTLLSVGGPTIADKDIGIKSEWFLVQSWLKLDRASLNTEVLVNRKMTSPYTTNVVWIHQN
ncbi:type II secretion system minor pseudopilin GspK [Massilia sp. S19_KUP03_FR1]|uniref:type II secretion system minor pseudopilin GspK n=1 Tax=Massilia sp. S19_KUP03_FR1 TaxID=3025503 RepID=UPI002FCDA54C